MTTYEVDKYSGETADDYVGEDEKIVSTRYAGGTEYVEVEEVEMVECDECGEEFETKRALRGHMSAHTDE